MTASPIHTITLITYPPPGGWGVGQVGPNCGQKGGAVRVDAGPGLPYVGA